MALKGLVAAAAVASGTRWVRAQGALPVGDSGQLADLGLTLSPEQRAAGVVFVERHPSVDTHSHPGRFFLKNLPFQTPTTRAFGEPFEHASFEVTRDVLQVSTKPVMVSHTNLSTPTANHPRLISGEHAKLVAGAGSIIGSWPSGFGLSSFGDYIDAIMRLVDVVGIDHTAIGTDMDANFKPVLRSYRDWSLIPAALLAHGMHEGEVAKIMGGNFLRVFRSNLGQR
jgi:hypothetical protein